MAYFLDEALDILTKAEQAAPAARHAVSGGTPRKAATNRYAAKCVNCETMVSANTGVLTKRGAKWVVSHASKCS